MLIRCRITWINDPALYRMSRVIWEEMLQVTQAKEIKAALWFTSLPAFDLVAVKGSSVQMAWMRLAAHCSLRYHRCHLVSPNLKHQPQSQLTGLSVGTCLTALGPPQSSLGSSHRAHSRRLLVNILQLPETQMEAVTVKQRTHTSAWLLLNHHMDHLTLYFCTKNLDLSGRVFSHFSISAWCNTFIHVPLHFPCWFIYIFILG